MKPSEIIYKKVPKFTNEHYLYLYELILRDLVEESQKKKKIERRDIFIVKCQSKKRNNYWLNISKAVTENDTHYSTVSQKVSVLMVDYLRLKIKNNIVPKIITLSNQIGRSIDYVIRIHMHINRYEIANKNERKSIHSHLKLHNQNKVLVLQSSETMVFVFRLLFCRFSQQFHFRFHL